MIFLKHKKSFRLVALIQLITACLMNVGEIQTFIYTLKSNSLWICYQHILCQLNLFLLEQFLWFNLKTWAVHFFPFSSIPVVFNNNFYTVMMIIIMVLWMSWFPLKSSEVYTKKEKEMSAVQLCLSSWKRTSCVFCSSWCRLFSNESETSCIYTVIQLHKQNSVLVKKNHTLLYVGSGHPMLIK